MAGQLSATVLPKWHNLAWMRIVIGIRRNKPAPEFGFCWQSHKGSIHLFGLRQDYLRSDAADACAFRNFSRRKNFRCNAPEYPDHISSPESLASAARTAASFESRSSM